MMTILELLEGLKEAKSEKEEYNLIFAYERERYTDFTTGAYFTNIHVTDYVFDPNTKGLDADGVFSERDPKHCEMLLAARIEIALDEMIEQLHKISDDKDNLFLKFPTDIESIVPMRLRSKVPMRLIGGKPEPAPDLNVAIEQIQAFLSTFTYCFDSVTSMGRIFARSGKTGTTFLVETLTWSSKCTHLVKQLFSFVSTLFQIDLDSCSQEMNVNDNCYKTWKYNSAHPAALHIVLNSVAIEPALA